jgi:hypothetical protein
MMTTVLHHVTHWWWAVASIGIVASHRISRSHRLRERVGAAVASGAACAESIEVSVEGL